MPRCQSPCAQLASNSLGAETLFPSHPQQLVQSLKSKVMAEHQEVGLLHAPFPFFLTPTSPKGADVTVHTTYPLSLPI